MPLVFGLHFFADYALLALLIAVTGFQSRLWRPIRFLYQIALLFLTSASVVGIYAHHFGNALAVFAWIRDFLFYLYPAVAIGVMAMGVQALFQRLWWPGAMYLAFAAVVANDFLAGHHYIASPFLTKYLHLTTMFGCLFALIRRAAAAQAQEKIIRRAERDLAHLAQQVDHDIRSPLAALHSVTTELGDASDDVRTVIRMAIERIRDIADSLRSLRGGRGPSYALGQVATLDHASQLSGLVAGVMAEKRVQYAGHPGLKLTYTLAFEAHNQWIDAPAGQIQRVMSNLVNSAVEAIDGCGDVRVTVFSTGSKACVSILDNGPGMPAAVMARLGERGATFGKASGSGLSIHHAMSTVQQLNGNITFKTPPSGGTEVTVVLPTVSPKSAPSAVPARSQASA